VDRRAFIGALAGEILASAFGVEAQPAQQVGRGPRIGVLAVNHPEDRIGSPMDSHSIGIIEGLREHGWVIGQNITVDWRTAAGKPDRLLALAEELVRLRVVLILVNSFAAVQEVVRLDPTVPIVWVGVFFWALSGAGLAKDINRPGGRVTGLASSAGPEVTGKNLQLLKEAAPGSRRVAYISSPPYPETPPGIEASTRALNVQLLPVPVANPGSFDKAFQAIKKARVDALYVGASPFFVTERTRIIDFAARERLPAVYWWRGFAESGGLMAYSIDWADLYRRSGGHVDKILRGTSPGDIPIEQPTRYELIINLKTARALGLTIPSSLLTRADQVIE
jgi:putative tryptophan/tyrosine transport system substrate-binding protein